VRVAEKDKPKTVLTTPFGLYEFNRMPFCLTNAPATFQRLMERCLSGLNLKICLVYLDNVIVFARTFEEMLERLEAVLRRLGEFGLKLKPSKCKLFQTKLTYLGHVVSENGVEPDPEKISALPKWLCRNQTLKCLRHSCVGLGAVLYQLQSGKKRVLAYGSRSLTHSEQRYCAYCREFLALKWAVTEKFRSYLYGRKFHVITDSNPLTYLLTSAKLSATDHRWLASLSTYDFTISYRTCGSRIMTPGNRTTLDPIIPEAIPEEVNVDENQSVTRSGRISKPPERLGIQPERSKFAIIWWRQAYSINKTQEWPLSFRTKRMIRITPQVIRTFPEKEIVEVEEGNVTNVK
ncbi:Hypothetical predicted protein, partial [Paramuricea clavata]